MSWNEGLTDEQINAASYGGTYARLLAGPGTGKTTSITRRIIYLITELNIEPSKILVLTFTRAATAELISRVQSELPENNNLPQISTLHSFALQTILRQTNSSRLPIPIFIADDYEERHIIQEDLKSILNLTSISESQDLLNKLSADWEQLHADQEDWEDRFPDPRFLGAWREHRNIYGYVLRAELVYQLKQIFQESDPITENQFHHIIIDEYQDLNACDLSVIKYLTLNNDSKLYIAGDDDQSIYGFRYANPEGIRRFNNEFQPSSSLTLSVCKRCDQTILNLAQYVANQDPRRIEKVLNPDDSAGVGELNILRFNDQNSEANGIARICSHLVNDNGIEPGKILILLRSDRYRIFSDPIREALIVNGLDVSTVSNPLEVLNTNDGRTFITILRLMVNIHDNLSWRTFLKIRQNNIGTTIIDQIYEHARLHNKKFSEALFDIQDNPSLIPRFGNRIKNELIQINQIVNDCNTCDYSNLEELFRFISDNCINGENVDDILSLFQRVLNITQTESLLDFLRVLNISLDNNEQEINPSTINIMTMHQAKGLSADAVFIAAAEQEYIPGRNSVDDERRLLFVSLTRAKHYLIVTHCSNRHGSQRHSGSVSGRSNRNLTEFLSGGPIHSINANIYLNSLDSD